MLGAFNRFYLSAAALPVLALALTMPVAAEPVPRTGTAAGAVIARKVGEEVRFIDVSNWQTVDLKQDLISGDILRTNETGQLAILFSDRTQVRLGRNSSLVVKQVTSSTDADTVLQLQSGTIWARAERGGPGVKVETAAAAAAIRGTDWTMTVNGANTSLTVLEGLVSLSNPQGSVEVRQGEGAAATIGQAPRKIAIVNSNDREQMLFYLPAREAFERMPPSVRPTAEIRRDAGRITAIPAERRSAEDWVSLAEAQIWLDGRQKAKETLAHIKGLKLSSSQQARITLMEAIVAATETRYADAAKLFAKAEGGLDTKRRGLAVYGGYYARSLADPNRVEPLPNKVTSAKDAFLRAYALGVTKDIKSAIQAMAEAEKRFPDDPEIPAYRAWMALLLNDREQIKQAIDKAMAVDPEEPVALEARSHYLEGIQGDIKGALADAEAVVRIAPGTSTAWNQIGNLQAERDANREAEAAFKKAIELDPEDALSRANLAGFYLNLNRVEDAKREIDLALEHDPSLSFALLVRGQYHLQTGDTDKAIEDLLAGTVADPGIAMGQVMLSAAQYQKGDRIAGAQALDNADRLDKNDASISAMRTAIAIDEYDADGAMKYARDFLERSRARGGDYASLGASRDAGSTLNNAFRLQGLDAWGQYYGDVVFDPFSGTSYLDQTIRGSVNPLANSFGFGGDIINNTPNSSTFSSLIQGLLFEPHMIAGRSRSAGLVQQPFIEGAIGGGIAGTGDNTGWIGTAELQGFTNAPVPLSFYLDFSWEQLNDTTREISDDTFRFDLDNETRLLSGTAYVTASPTLDDRLVAYLSRTNREDNLDLIAAPLPAPLPPSIGFPYLVDNQFTTAGLGWSHTFGYHNVVNAALFYTELNSNIEDSFTLLDPTRPFPVFTNTHTTVKNYVAAVSHSYGLGDTTLRYGIEGGWIDTTAQNSISFLGITIPGASTRASMDYGRLYADVLHVVTPDLKIEYALHGVLYDSDAISISRLEPRIGLAWSPVEGQWLRAGFLRQGTDMSTPTLSPIGLLGMQPNEFGVGIEGYSDTIALRWDAEWNDRLFTAIDYQHQIVRDISISDIVSQNSFDYDRATIDRVAFTANAALGHGFGLSGTYAYTQSRHNSPPPLGADLPFLPEHSGQIALTWVSPENLKATIAANYIGERQGDGTTEILDDYWTLDAKLIWEPFDKRFELEAAAYNLLDEDFQVATNTNGWGRSFKGTLKVRF